MEENEKTLKIDSLEGINSVARQFIKLIGDRRIFAFYGDMGVGKTTFIKAICEELGVEDTTNSPSFAIVNEYRAPKGKIIYHLDFYRIDHVEEAFDFGYEDYFYGNAICFIEWPEKIASILPSDTVKVYLSEEGQGKRSIRLS